MIPDQLSLDLDLLSLDPEPLSMDPLSYLIFELPAFQKYSTCWPVGSFKLCFVLVYLYSCISFMWTDSCSHYLSHNI